MRAASIICQFKSGAEDVSSGFQSELVSSQLYDTAKQTHRGYNKACRGEESCAASPEPHCTCDPVRVVIYDPDGGGYSYVDDEGDIVDCDAADVGYEPDEPDEADAENR